MSLFALVLFFLISSIPLAHSATTMTPTRVPNYLFVLQWGAAYCNVQGGAKCQGKSRPTSFTVHGLWPEVQGGHCGTTFSMNLLTDEQKEKLKKFMPDLIQYPHNDVRMNLIFWTKEWKKHGCFTGMTVTDYFQAILDLYGQLLPFTQNFREICHLGGICDPDSVAKEYGQRYSKRFLIECTESNEEKAQIQEIHFNVTADGKRIQPMLGPYSKDCNGPALFPSPGRV